MYLKEIKIINWQGIEKIEIKFENLMLFLGQSNSGKSSIISAIMFFLGYRNFRSKDLKIGKNFIEIEGRFYNYFDKKFRVRDVDINYKNIRLKIFKHATDELQYFINFENSWLELSEQDYLKITKSIPLLFIPSFSEKEQTEFFISTLLNILEEKNIDKPLALNKIINSFNQLESEYTSRGLYRNLIFEIFCALTHYTQKLKTSILENTLILFEEPELYLHPQKEKELFDNICLLSRLGTQVYISTHSSNFINLHIYKSICIIRRDEKSCSQAFQFKGHLFSGDEIKNFNMNYWINPDRSELFFAKKVILVEGQTDKIVLWYLAKKLEVYKYEYSILECGSKSLIPQFIKLLNAFQIPYIAVYDKDNHLWRTPEEIENSNLKNKLIQKTVRKDIGEWLEFENDIEEEIYQENRERKNYKNKPFYALKTVTDENFIIPNQLEKKVKKIFK